MLLKLNECVLLCALQLFHLVNKFEQLSHVPLVTTPIDNNLTIDLLVRLDYYWAIVLPGVMPIGQCLVTQETLFGWLISGCTGDTAGDSGDGQGETFSCWLSVSVSFYNQ